MMRYGLPPKQGLYDPSLEHDACGIGFVADLKREASHTIVEQATAILCRLTHRGAAGADEATGDGAGMLIQTPDKFLRKVAVQAGFGLPAHGSYASALAFLAVDRDERSQQISIIEEVVAAEGQRFIGWRDVPTDPDAIGEIARTGMPAIQQFFVAAADGLDQAAFERKLYIIRRLIENRVDALETAFHIPSLSSKTFLYKGMFLAHQTPEFFPDLQDPDMESRLAVVHQRYSTNTFPTWDLAQPFRYLAHNGEINTIRGNQNWMNAREGTLQSDLFGEDLKKLFPVMRNGTSDSARFDNALEFLHLGGRDLPHSMLMMIPEAWENQDTMAAERRAFYEYHSCMLEPWDGPASMCFSNGDGVGAVLDRNGLRPSRYVLTKDGLLVMGSEVGTLHLDPAEIESKGRLEPGRIFYADLEEGRIVEDAELKDRYISRHPYKTWVETHQLELADLPAAELIHRPNPEIRLALQQTFGYTLEDMRFLMAPMASNGKEALGSMGEDAALACLSDKPRLLFGYFKQNFAQVTNPAIDSIRERPVMTLDSTLGEEKNLLVETPEHARLLRLHRPVLRDAELEAIRQIDQPGFKAETLSTLYKAGAGGEGLRSAIDKLCREASQAIAAGANILILSDRGVSPELAPIPSLLATGAVHHHLIRESSRTRCGLIVETGEAREVAHFALLVGYGAGAINPYLALETVRDLVEDGAYTTPADLDPATAEDNYLKAIDLGLLKIFAKMGISTLQSYRGAQIFEAVGLGEEVVKLAFDGTHSRVKGVGLDVISREVEMRHDRGFPGDAFEYPELDAGGLYQWRLRGEQHSFNPESVSKLQHAVRNQSWKSFEEYTRAADDDAVRMRTLRGLLEFDFDREPVPLEEVEESAAIVTRFCTGAMSYGSISAEAHETLAIAMNRLGGKSNTGEGGEDPKRWTPDANGDSRRSAIKQVASGRFGVTSAYLVNSDEMQIKIAQGAKPGEGGELPGHKVDQIIAKTRYSTPGVGLLFDRRSLAADSRSEERESTCQRERQTRLRDRCWHDRLGRLEGQGRWRADFGSRWGNRGFRADFDQECRLSLGNRARRDPADAGPERSPRSHQGPGRWRLQDGSGRGDRRASRRRRVRIRDRSARRARLHPDARLSSEHLSRRNRDAASRVAGTLRWATRERHPFLLLHCGSGS
jgi:glutamate synthase domain-containing protein 1